MRLDVLGDWPRLLVVFSAIASVLGLVRAVVEHVRQGTGSIRLLVSWFAATLGLLIALAALGALLTQRPPMFSRDGIMLGSVTFAGVLLALIGAVVAIRTASPDQKTLSAIAAIVQGSMNLPAGIVKLAPLGVHKVGTEGERTSLSRLLSRPPSKQIILSGPPGSGKTVTLQAIVATICERAVQSRRPRRLALYVDLQSQQLPDGAIDETTIKNQLKASVPGKAEQIAAYVEEPRFRPRWLFVFDLGDGLTETQVDQYVRAVRGFMAERDDCAVVATRIDLGEESAYTMAPLVPRERQALLKNMRTTARPHPAVLRRLQHDPRLADIAGNPLLFGLLGKWLVTDELSGSAHRILSEITTTHLGPEKAAAATRLAYRLIDQPNTDVPRDATADALVETGLARCGPAGFRFRHPVVLHHLAGEYLRSPGCTADVPTLLAMDCWRPAMIAALQAGPSTFREQVIKTVAVLVADETTGVTDLVPDAGALADGRRLPVPGSFTWPRATLGLLTFLGKGLADDPGEERATEVIPGVDRLVLTAVTSGAGIDRSAGLELLPLASCDAAVAAAGVGLSERRFFEEGLSGPSVALAQTARRWTRLAVEPFERGRHWRALLKAIEKQLVLTHARPGQLTSLTDYLFARTGGHIGSLMTLITRSCFKAIKTGDEQLSQDLLDTVRIDEASEKARHRFEASTSTSRTTRRAAS